MSSQAPEGRVLSVWAICITLILTMALNTQRPFSIFPSHLNWLTLATTALSKTGQVLTACRRIRDIKRRENGKKLSTLHGAFIYSFSKGFLSTCPVQAWLGAAEEEGKLMFAFLESSPASKPQRGTSCVACGTFRVLMPRVGWRKESKRGRTGEGSGRNLDEWAGVRTVHGVEAIHVHMETLEHTRGLGT